VKQTPTTFHVILIHISYERPEIPQR
jgi:hypothetical protein